MSRWLLLCILATALMAPILAILLQLDLNTLSELLGSTGFKKSLWITLVSGIGGSLLSSLAAIAFAKKFAIYQWRMKRFQRLVLLVPYLVPNFILASAFVISWNPATGLLNSWLPFPGELYGVWGMTLVFGIVHIPVAFLLLEDRIRRIDPALREAARLAGASFFQIFFKIELPLIRSSLMSAISLCFALNISAFAIPAWIGSPAKAYPLTYRVYQALQTGGLDAIATASAYSFVLFLLTVIPLFLLFWSGRNYSLVTGKASRIATISQRPSSRFQFLFWGIQFVSWILPLSCLALSTFVPPGCLQREGFACFENFSLHSYSYVLFDLKETHDAFRNSFLYGSLSAAVIIFISVLSLWIFQRRPGLLRLWETICSIPVATPGAVIALGLIVGLSGRFGINLYNTAWIVVVAFVIKHLNLAYQPIRNGFFSLSPSLLDAGRVCGASEIRLWTKIVLPILSSEVLGAFFLVLIPILGELTMSIFLASPSFRSIGTVLFDLQDYADQSSAGALSIILVVVVLLLNESARCVSKGKIGF